MDKRAAEFVRRTRGIILAACPGLWAGQGAIVRPSEDDAKHVANDTSEPFLSVIGVPSQSRGNLTSAKQQPRLDSACLLRHK